MNGSVGAFCKRLFDGLPRALGAQRNDDDFSAVFLFLAKRLFERVGIRLAHLVADIAVIDPLLIRRYSQDRILLWHLLQTHDDVHTNPLWKSRSRLDPA